MSWKAVQSLPSHEGASAYVYFPFASPRSPRPRSIRSHIERLREHAGSKGTVPDLAEAVQRP
jgi:hypothetical protein